MFIGLTTLSHVDGVEENSWKGQRGKYLGREVGEPGLDETSIQWNSV